MIPPSPPQQKTTSKKTRNLRFLYIAGGVKEGYKKLKETVLALPEANKYFLQVLMKLLHQVAEPKNAEKNMMKSSNIVIVFAPILLYKKDASPFDTGDFKNINLIIDGMINFYDIIFGVRVFFLFCNTPLNRLLNGKN